MKLPQSIHPAAALLLTCTLLNTAMAATQDMQARAVALVRSMREDEIILLSMKPFVVKNPVQEKCFATMQRPVVTEIVAKTVAAQLTEQEIADATRFYASEAGKKVVSLLYMQEHDRLPPTDPRLPTLTMTEQTELGTFGKQSAGRKLLIDKVIQQESMGKLVLSEVRDHLFRCGEIATGAQASKVCRSAPVETADKKCAAHYEVTERVGEKGRKTNVTVRCHLEKGIMASSIAELSGQHELGMGWRDDKTLEIVLPAGLTPLRKQTSDAASAGLKYEYRPRKTGDSQALACVSGDKQE